MAAKQKAVQTRLPEKLLKRLVKVQKKSGVLSLSEYLRIILTQHVESEEEKERN